MTNLKQALALIFILVASSAAMATHLSSESVEARIAPIGSINFSHAPSSGQTMGSTSGNAMDGPSVYASSCGTCHDAGVAGAPVTGKSEDWAGRLDAGMEVLVRHAVNGFQGNKGVMPAKGGNINLSDEEVAEAVKHMVGLLETDGTETAADTASSEPVQAESAMTVASGNTGQGGDYVLDSAVAKATYTSYCSVCHAAGIAGAPVNGDKAGWEPRLAQGIEVLVDHAINGYQGDAGVMPAKGGFTNLSDEEVAQAVYFMVEQLK